MVSCTQDLLIGAYLSTRAAVVFLVVAAFSGAFLALGAWLSGGLGSRQPDRGA